MVTSEDFRNFLIIKQSKKIYTEKMCNKHFPCFFFLVTKLELI